MPDAHPTPLPGGSRLKVFAVLLAVAGAAFYLWLGWCAFPASNWNELRLAPTFALRHGETLYPLLRDGPVSTWIYGPVGLLVNLPATLASSASVAIQVAGAINVLVLVAPLAVVFFTSPDLRARGWPARLLALALAVLLLPVNSLEFQVADHVAIAFGLLASLCLARASSAKTSSVVVAAALTALAVWSKQTAVFLVPAHALYFALRREWRTAGRYVFWVLVFGLCLLAVAVIAFGFDGLWLNLVEIPARLPWGDVADKLTRRALQLALQIGGAGVSLLLLRRLALWPPRDTEAGRFLHITLLVSAVGAPIGFWSFFKVGGDVNALHWWFYLVPALGLAWFTGNRGACVSSRGWLALVACVLLARTADFRSLPLAPQTAPLAMAGRLAHANPGTVWFPYNPLVTFYTDRKLYHVEDGIATRHLAGLGLNEASFRRHLPVELVAIFYPREQTDCFALQLLPAFNQRTVMGDWAAYQRKAGP